MRALLIPILSALSVAGASYAGAYHGALTAERDLDEASYTTPTTCAECVTDSDCDRLCGVAACTECKQTGCWMPEDLYDRCEEEQ